MAHPRAHRTEITVLDEGEVVVLTDEATGVAHEVTAFTSWVWQEADGQRTVDQLTEGARRAFPTLEVTTAAVYGACDELADVGLLVERITPPAAPTLLSRRRILRDIGIGVAATAAVTAAGTGVAAAGNGYGHEKGRGKGHEKGKGKGHEKHGDGQAAEQQAKQDAEQQAKQDAEEQSKLQEQQAKADQEQQNKESGKSGPEPTT